MSWAGGIKTRSSATAEKQRVSCAYIQIWAVGSKRRIFSATECVLAVQVHSRSSKVNHFGTNRTRIYEFLLVINSNFGPILHRFRDTATYWLKIANFFNFFPPTIIRRPRSLGSLWNFALKLTIRKLESWAILQWRPHDRSLSRFGMIPACDGRSVSQTVRFTIASTALSIASYADAL